MNRTTLLLALAPAFALAACGSQPTPQPTQTAMPTPTATINRLPPPDQETFSKVLAKACPDADKVVIATCKANGMGATSFICQFGLGKDKYLRNTATVDQKDGEYVLVDADKICAAHPKGKN